MKIEHLVATIHQTDTKLYEKMNIKCDAIITNQIDKVSYTVRRKDGKAVKMLSTNTKGVGINRNLGLIMSSADVCILSDDDMKYNDDYIVTISNAFKKLKNADIIIFNIRTIGEKSTRRRINKKIKRIHYFNFMNYGAARIVFKRYSVLKNNVWFTTLFGGGSKYSSGEDTLFLAAALRKRMKIYAFPAEIAIVNQEKSTWFNGCNEKFFYDKGALIGQIFPILKYFFILFYYPCRFKSELKYMMRIKCLFYGMKNYKYGFSYDDWKKMI